jgi:hypothetical protein
LLLIPPSYPQNPPWQQEVLLFPWEILLLDDITKIPRYRQFHTNMQGCNFWWLEYGGRLDTIHQTEEIKWELWKVIYGVWNYYKNSGKFPEAETMNLEWVGTIPGKRESRRFEGDYIIRQQDLVEQTAFDDAIVHGGWAVDLHPADGVYSELSGCTQWHSKGVYGIPYRCHYSRNISNLFLAGRIISATHVAFGSTRVMATCAAGGQAVGTAAALCHGRGLLPRDLSGGENLRELQLRLERLGQFLPGIETPDPADLTGSATPAASSRLKLGEIPACDDWLALDSGWAMLLPLPGGPCPVFGFEISADQPGAQRIELRRAAKPGNFTPDELLEAIDVAFPAGTSRLEARFTAPIDRAGYHFVKLAENPALRVRLSDARITGILAVTSACNKQVATSNLQSPPDGIGIDTFEFWLPQRRPHGRNLALTLDPPLDVFAPENISHGPSRPTQMPNAWVADPTDPRPELTLAWPAPVRIARVIIDFDPDWDHAMESVLMTHPEEVVPFMVRDFDLLDGDGKILAEIRGHHSARFDHRFPEALETKHLTLRIHATHGAPAAVFRMRALPLA